MAEPETTETDPRVAERESLKDINQDYAERFGFHDQEETYSYKAEKGLSREVVTNISEMKNEPGWMRDFRIKAYEHFESRPTPTWGGNLGQIDWQNIHYFVRASEKQGRSWDEVPEDIKNTFDRLGIPEAERKFLAGVGAQYECLAEEALVWTASGHKPIREVEAGDTVFAFDEESDRLVPAAVKGRAHKGRRPVYRVKVGNREIRATENHPFLCLEYNREEGRVRGRYRRRWKYLRDLREGDLVAVSKQLPDVGSSHDLSEMLGERDVQERDHPITAPERSTPELMWWLGLYIGDGFVHRSNGRKRRVEVAIPATETELRVHLAEETRALFGTTPSFDANRVTVGATQVAEVVERLGFAGGAHEKRLPGWVYSLGREERLAFLAGYIDADGYVRNHPKNKDVAITSGNVTLLEQVRQLALGCGLRCSRLAHFASRHPHERDRMVEGHRLFIGGDVSHLPFRNPRRRERVGKHRYSHRHSSAKGTDFRRHVNEWFGYVRIGSIEADGEAEVYDIEVDGPHNFVAEGLIVHNSEVVYHQVREDLEAQGVHFLDMDTALREHEDLVREYWGTIIPPNDNKLAALNSAVWSGGSFVYVPAGVKVEMPLQAYFRINTENMGQFERTLIIAEEGSDVHYTEGCTAPVYSSDSLHSAVVEIVAKRGSRVRYTTVQNWSQNVFNLVTKRAVAHEDATMEWVDCNLGCLTGDSMIGTPDRGPVPIAEIREGDEVFGTDLQAMSPVARRVTATRENGVQATFRITTENFRQLEATANHPFLVLDRAPHGRSYSVRWRRLENVSVGDYVAVSKGSPDAGRPRFLGDYAYEPPSPRSRPRPIQTPLETTEDLMWVLGVFIGDGGVEKSHGRPRRVNFAVPPNDHARPRLERTLREVFGVEGVDKGPATLAVNSSVLGDFILWLGLGGNAHSKRIPGWVFTLPAAQKLAFIEGYLDSDGHERRRKVVDGVEYGQITWASVNRALLEDLKSLLIDCGLEPRKISTYESSRRLPLGVEEKVYTTHYLAMNIRGNLEAIRSHRAPRPVVEFVRVASIEELEPQPTYDIEVEGIENFTANGIVVHNSKLTMKYPSIYLVGERAHGEILSIAFAGQGQHQDAGGKIIHAAPRTTSSIFSKSISKDGGRGTYRGLLEVAKGARESRSKVVCDALLLDEHSRSDTYPTIRINEDDSDVGHEASVSKIGEEQLFYLMSRGLSEEDAAKMIVNGFIEPITKELPMEYSVEMNRLIELQMEGSIG